VTRRKMAEEIKLCMANKHALKHLRSHATQKMAAQKAESAPGEEERARAPCVGKPVASNGRRRAAREGGVPGRRSAGRKGRLSGGGIEAWQ